MLLLLLLLFEVQLSSFSSPPQGAALPLPPSGPRRLARPAVPLSRCPVVPGASAAEGGSGMTTLGRPGTAEGIGSVNTQISSLQGCFDNLVYSLEMEACRLATEKQSLAEERQKVEQAQHESTKRLESLDRLVQAGSAWQRHLDRSSTIVSNRMEQAVQSLGHRVESLHTASVRIETSSSLARSAARSLAPPLPPHWLVSGGPAPAAGASAGGDAAGGRPGRPPPQQPAAPQCQGEPTEGPGDLPVTGSAKPPPPALPPSGASGTAPPQVPHSAPAGAAKPPPPALPPSGASGTAPPPPPPSGEGSGAAVPPPPPRHAPADSAGASGSQPPPPAGPPPGVSAGPAPRVPHGAPAGAAKSPPPAAPPSGATGAAPPQVPHGAPAGGAKRPPPTFPPSAA